MRGRMSTVEPFGTWQYAHAVCLPLGARVSSNRLCCASRTNGRSAWRPSQNGALGVGDLVERAAEMHGACLRDFHGAPGNRPVERVIHLEDAGAVPPALEPPAVTRRQRVARECGQRGRAHVAQHEVARR